MSPVSCPSISYFHSLSKKSVCLWKIKTQLILPEIVKNGTAFPLGKKNLILILTRCSSKVCISAVITDFFLYIYAHTHSTSFWSVYTEMGWNVAQFYKYLICNYIFLASTTSFYLFSTWKFLSLGFHIQIERNL